MAETTATQPATAQSTTTQLATGKLATAKSAGKLTTKYATKLTDGSVVRKEQRVINQLLEKFQVAPDGVLLVHSAFKDFNRDGYDADLVLQALVKYMKPGTLLLPTMSWRFVKPNNPVFDELATPCNTGILAEKFRLQFATQRSIHPTHSVAGTGKYAAEILATHHLSATPCDQLSPFGKLVEYGAHIIMLGVGMDCCTMLHHAEEIIAPNLYVQPENTAQNYLCVDRTGKQHTVALRKHFFLPRNYWQFQDLLAQQGKLAVFNCDNAITLGFTAADIVATAVAALTKQPDLIIAKPGQRYRLM